MIPTPGRTPVATRPTEPCVQGGRYWLRTPGGAIEPYTRVSRWVETLEDPWAVHRWRMRNLSKAITAHPELAEQLAAAQTDDEAEAVIDTCLDRVGANDRRDLGTLIHTWCEQLMSGVRPEAGEHLPVVEAIARCLAANRLDPVEVEGTVVCTDLKVAGRRDLVCRQTDGSLVVVDYKTGSHVSHGSWAVQLACYANADQLYNWADHSWTLRSPVNTVLGLICHADALGPLVQLHHVDLAWGWRQATDTIPTIRQARNEQKHRARGQMFGMATAIDRDSVGELADTLEASVTALRVKAREDRAIDDETVEGMKTRIGKLAPALRSVMEGWAKEAHAAGLSLNISQHRRLLRFEQLRAACGLVTATEGDLDQCRAAMRLLDGTTSPTIGDRIARLDLEMVGILTDELIPNIPTFALFYDQAGQPNFNNDNQGQQNGHSNHNQ